MEINKYMQASASYGLCLENNVILRKSHKVTASEQDEAAMISMIHSPKKVFSS